MGRARSRNKEGVTVSNGWVTLGGTVDWYYEKKAAEEDVRKLSGVLGVFNKIEIKPQVRAADVKRKIEEALKRHAEVEANAIQRFAVLCDLVDPTFEEISFNLGAIDPIRLPRQPHDLAKFIERGLGVGRKRRENVAEIDSVLRVAIEIRSC